MTATAELFEINNEIREILSSVQQGAKPSHVSFKTQESLTKLIDVSNRVIDLCKEGGVEKVKNEILELERIGHSALEVATEEYSEGPIVDRITALHDTISHLKV